jgi:hypothetical protein
MKAVTAGVLLQAASAANSPSLTIWAARLDRMSLRETIVDLLVSANSTPLSRSAWISTGNYGMVPKIPYSDSEVDRRRNWAFSGSYPDNRG